MRSGRRYWKYTFELPKDELVVPERPQLMQQMLIASGGRIKMWAGTVNIGSNLGGFTEYWGYRNKSPFIGSVSGVSGVATLREFDFSISGGTGWSNDIEFTGLAGYPAQVRVYIGGTEISYGPIPQSTGGFYIVTAVFDIFGLQSGGSRAVEIYSA